ncbi:3-ketoacyl-ACP reductase [Paracoccus sp. (in: a-proteobacteria)]|uniref:3-ketoacyl-ACP reductase n=1 Tax=Paracoccus sp. TaxID=267 RepID=UPI003A87066D
MSGVALVTGASRGIGLAVARSLAAEGFAVAVNGIADDQELREAVAGLRDAGGRVMAAPFDVTDIAGHARELSRIEAELGPLTTLVNNAGVGVISRGDLLDVTEESWDRCANVNSKAMFFLSQAFARLLLSRPRPVGFHSIVNVTSSNASAVAVARSEYCASKAAAAMVSKALAVRLGQENIAVYDVQPGVIATDMTASVIETYRERIEAGMTLFPRIGQPADMGAIIATLASGRLPYTTGQVISADAGMLVPRY